ncbi:hypothetical protein CGCF415_v014289 [Colletotrichum fructicola]|nr:uncharacterized protein CGMCC3_g6144 [Colletotrichum fructicola]KAE9577649.1 hypothetical protein CGMCC3_g6144 [Colletotrichum fructicola]KAF4887987.1 hypothetical protein CGCFRS4_v010130 [Colletotrichum fructicola]KAF4888940.1 hypothetical protein CGCF415_v014289 [Colletotrichum fructicola]KAF5486148.1 hypothetical protein CGCF413_v013477 [Colletotrichum fructicola]
MIVVEGVSSTVVELLVTTAAGELEETLISLDDWMEGAGVATLDTETNVLGDGEMGLEVDTVGTELRIGTLDETGNTELGNDMAGSEVGREVGRDDGTERGREAGTDPGLELGLGLTTGNVVREELCPGTGPGLELGSETGGVSTGLGDGATTMGELVITCEVAGTDAKMLEFVNRKEDEGLKTSGDVEAGELVGVVVGVVVDAVDDEVDAPVAEVEEEDDELAGDETLDEVEVIVEGVLSLLVSVALDIVDEVLEVEEVIVLLVTLLVAVELKELVALVDVGVNEETVLDVLLLEEVVVTTVDELMRVLELLLELDVVELPGEVEIGWSP